jgi:hypothetical protein
MIEFEGNLFPMVLAKKLKAFLPPWLPDLLSGIGAAFYMIQIFLFTHSQDSILDEGLYLLKGYWFAVGEYVPFEAYGPWTNKMPLAFLVPGYVQKFFGPSFRMGRYYAGVLAVLIFLGVWITSRRFGGRWGSAAAAAMIVLNPAPTKLYSIVASEGIIAAMLIWVVVLMMGKDRPFWQLLLGSCITGAIVITRSNLGLVFPIMMGYVFWEHGWRKGLLSLLVGLLPVAAGHILYWPKIMILWVKWIPENISPFLESFRIDFTGAERIYDPDPGTIPRIKAFFQGIRFHFAALVGFLTTVFFLPEDWKERSQFKSFVSLVVLFFSLLVLHIYGSVVMNINVSGYYVYLAFFSVLGIVITAGTIKSWQLNQPEWKMPVLVGLVILLSLGIFYSYASPSTYIGKRISIHLLLRPTSDFLVGWEGESDGLIWQTINQAVGINYAEFIRLGTVVILLGLESLMIAGLILLTRKAISFGNAVPVPSLIQVAFFSLGTVLAPTNLLGGGMEYLDCRWGVISQHEQAARKIAAHVKDGEEIFWLGDKSQVVLLELEAYREVSYFPQQLNANFSRRIGGDPEELGRHGYWNDTLAADWLQQSEVVLIEKQVPAQAGRVSLGNLELDAFQQVGETSQIGCEGQTTIEIYRRIP